MSTQNIPLMVVQHSSDGQWHFAKDDKFPGILYFSCNNYMSAWRTNQTNYWIAESAKVLPQNTPEFWMELDPTKVHASIQDLHKKQDQVKVSITEKTLEDITTICEEKELDKEVAIETILEKWVARNKSKKK